MGRGAAAQAQPGRGRGAWGRRRRGRPGRREAGKPGPGAGSGALKRRARRAGGERRAAGLRETARPLLPRPGSRRRGREAAPGAPGPREPPLEEAAAASIFWRRAGRAAGAEVRRGVCVGSSEEERGAGVARAVRGPAEP